MLTSEDFVFVPVEKATVSPGGIVMCYKDRYWAVDAQGRIAFYNPKRRNGRRQSRDLGSPQCNAQEAIARNVMESCDWAVDAVFLPFVFHIIDPSDYA